MAGSGRAVPAVILNLKQGDAAVDGACEKLYRALSAKGVDVLYDDTDQRAGAKFAAADLIGIPWQIMVGPKGLAEGKIELKRRGDGSRENLRPATCVRVETDARMRLIHRRADGVSAIRWPQFAPEIMWMIGPWMKP